MFTFFEILCLQIPNLLQQNEIAGRKLQNSVVSHFRKLKFAQT